MNGKIINNWALVRISSLHVAESGYYWFLEREIVNNGNEKERTAQNDIK